MCTNVYYYNVYQRVPYYNVYLVHFTTIQCLRLSSPSSAAFSQAVQLLGIEIQIQKQLEDPNIFFFAVFYHLPCCCILPVSPFFLNCIVHGWLLSKFENSFSLSSKILCASWSIVNGGRILETKYKRSWVGWFWFLFGLGLTICQIEISADIHWISWTWSWFWKVCLDLAPILFNLSSFLFPCAAAAAACSRPQNCLESCVFLDCVCFSVSFRMIWNIFFLKGIFISFQSCFAVAAHHERESNSSSSLFSPSLIFLLLNWRSTLCL